MSNVAVLDAARRLASVEGAKQVDQATWDFADAIVSDVPPEEGDGRPSPSGVKDGSRQAVKLLAESLARAGFDYSPTTLRYNRATALVWPEDTRIHKGAMFSAHLELRGQNDPPAVLRKLMKQHGGRVTTKQVRAWKREQNPPAFQSWSDHMRDRIKAVARQAATPEAKEEMAALLMAAARELLDGQ
jgi:hypothetical protein